MANQGFSRIFSWCETPPGSTKEVECACVPIHNASKLFNLPIDPDLDTTCVAGDILIWDGTEWVCGDAPTGASGVTGPTGPCCTGPTGPTGATSGFEFFNSNTAVILGVASTFVFGTFTFTRVASVLNVWIHAGFDAVGVNTNNNFFLDLDLSSLGLVTGVANGQNLGGAATMDGVLSPNVAQTNVGTSITILTGNPLVIRIRYSWFINSSIALGLNLQGTFSIPLIS